MTRNHLLTPLLAWLVLVVLTLLSLGLGDWLRGAGGLPLAVAAIVWIKGFVVARYFIGTEYVHPFIARVLSVFIGLVPVTLVLLAFWGSQFARWATL